MLYRCKIILISILLVVMVVASLNVRNVLKRRWARVEPFLNQINTDVLCLQEWGIPGGKEYLRFESRWK